MLMFKLFTTWSFALSAVVVAIPDWRPWLAAPSRILTATVGALSICLFRAKPVMTSWKGVKVSPVMYVWLELLVHHCPWIMTYMVLKRGVEKYSAPFLALPAAGWYHLATKNPPYPELLKCVPNAFIGYTTIGIFTLVDLFHRGSIQLPRRVL